jgi:hypothetical protein
MMCLSVFTLGITVTPVFDAQAKYSHDFHLFQLHTVEREINAVTV